jgi:hypothetical protein
MFYKASLDSLAQGVTIIFTLICLLLAFCCVFMFFDGGLSAVGAVLSALVLPIILGITYLFSVKGYALRNDELVITRPISPVHFAISDIESVDNTKIAATSSVRLFGSGGLFGYLGSFYNKRQGRFTLYATNRANIRLLTLKNGKKIGISPDDMTFFEGLSK